MIVEYNEKYNFNHIKAEEGMVITDYIEEMNILEYSSSKDIYTPANINLNRYYEITEEKNAEYKALQLKVSEENKEIKNMKDAKDI